MSKSPRQSSQEAVVDAEPSSPAPSFEKALAELERIVAQMEGGQLPLEQALATHKRGLELARYCQEKLEAAQQQVRVLEGEILKPLNAALGRRSGLPVDPGDDD